MDEGKATTDAAMKERWTAILNTAIKVITNPAEFFRGMAKSGGFVDPLIFMVVMGVIGGIVQAIAGLFRLGMGRYAGAGALTYIAIMPIGIAIGGFIGALILFVIWKLMGSQESYETAYRCGAYSAAIVPITMIIGLIPYVGGLITMAWGVYLLVMASVEVHKIAAKTAWLVFGIIGAILAIGGLSAERTARRYASGGYPWSRGSREEVAAEDMGKAATAFAKAMQEEAKRAQQEAAREAKESR
jgi:hypothetical protein